MTTAEMARSLFAAETEDELYRKLILFLVERNYGCGSEEEGRELERRNAHVHGFFWLPCILCGRWHSGMEISNTFIHLINYQRIGGGSGYGVCDRKECAEEAARINEMFPDGISPEALNYKPRR